MKNYKESDPEAINQIIEGSTFTTIVAKAKQLLRLQNAISQYLDSAILEHIQLMNFRDKTLIFSAKNAAWATRFRYLELDLIAHLQASIPELEIEHIQFRVIPFEQTPTAAPIKDSKLSPSSAKVIQEAACDIRNQTLKQALLKLAKI